MLDRYVVHDYAVQERVVDEDGEVAVVLQRVRMRAVVGEVDRSGVFVLSDVWRRHAGVWRVWRRHSTPLEAGVMPRLASSD